MEKTYLTKLANDLNTVPSNMVINNVINIDSNPYSFDGTFEAIYTALVTNKLKLLEKNGQIVGGSYDAGTSDIIQDNLASEAFMKAYSDPYKLMQYVTTAAMLVTAQLTPIFKTVNDKEYVYLLKQGVVLDVKGEVVVKVDLQNKYIEQIEEELDSELNNKLMEKDVEEDYDSCDDYDDYEEDELSDMLDDMIDDMYHDCSQEELEEMGCFDNLNEPVYEDEDVDDVISIPYRELDEEDRNVKGVKNYLRNYYGRYLKKGCEPDIYFNDSTKRIEVRHVEFGRKC